MCIILVNCFNRGLRLSVKVRLGKLTALDMTPLGWLGRETSTETNKQLVIFRTVILISVRIASLIWVICPHNIHCTCMFISCREKERKKYLNRSFVWSIVINPGPAEAGYALPLQCRSRSVSFLRSKLILSCTAYHLVCEFVSTIWIK